MMLCIIRNMVVASASWVTALFHLGIHASRWSLYAYSRSPLHGAILSPPQGHLADIFRGHNWDRVASGNSLIESRDAAEHTTKLSAALPSKNDLGQRSPPLRGRNSDLERNEFHCCVSPWAHGSSPA